MQEVTEYRYYEGTLIVGVHTPRLQPTPPTVFVAGGIHAQLAAKVRSALREYRTVEQVTTGLSAYLPVIAASQNIPLYGIRKIQPMGAPRSVDQDFDLEITSLRFGLGIAILENTFTVGDDIALALEWNTEAAAKALFKALSIPCGDIMVPGDGTQLGDTFIDVMCEMGPATEIGLVLAP